MPLASFTFTLPELQNWMRDFVYRPGGAAETEDRNEQFALLIQFSNWLAKRSHPEAWQADHESRWHALEAMGWVTTPPRCPRMPGEVGLRMEHRAKGVWTEFHLANRDLSYQQVHTIMLQACERFAATHPTPPRG